MAHLATTRNIPLLYIGLVTWSAGTDVLCLGGFGLGTGILGKKKIPGNLGDLTRCQSVSCRARSPLRTVPRRTVWCRGGDESAEPVRSLVISNWELE